MNPLLFFGYLVACAGGFFVVGLAAIGLALVWASIRGAAEKD